MEGPRAELQLRSPHCDTAGEHVDKNKESWIASDQSLAADSRMRGAPAFAAIAVIVLGCATTPHLEVGPVPPGVVVDSRLQYYDVSAASLAEIRQAMRQGGPRSDAQRRGGPCGGAAS